MRILMVANANQKDLAQRYYNTDSRLYNGFVRAGHHVLFFSDRDQARLNAPLIPSRKLGARRANDVLIKMVGEYRPDLIVFGHSTVITAQTVATIREKYNDLPLAHFNVDAIFSPNNDRFLNDMKGLFDTQFITTAGSALKRYSTDNKPVFFIPNIVDQSIHDARCFEQDSLPYDVLFLAHNNPWDDQTRVIIANHLKKSYSKANYLYGGFEPYPGLRGAAFTNALRSAAIGLNISRPVADGRAATPEELYLYSSERIAQLLGNGLLTFSYNKGGFCMEDLFAKDEIVLFESAEELVDKVQFFHKNNAERQRIAKKGWQRAHRDFSALLVADFILDKTLNRSPSHEYNWPVQGHAQP